MCNKFLNPHPFSPQVYGQDLAVFRDAALPRQFNRTFTENPDSNIIRDKLGKISTRYDRLKVTATDTTNALRDVVEKQQKFQDVADSLGIWLQDAEGSLKVLQKEAIGADPATVQKQIDRLKVRKTLKYVPTCKGNVSHCCIDYRKHVR